MKKLLIIILCFYAFLFAQEDNSNKRRVSFGLRLGGGIGLSTIDENYKAQFEWNKESETIEYSGQRQYHIYSYNNGKWKDFTGSFDAAAFLSLQMTNIFAVQTEALITRYCNNGYDMSFGHKVINYDMNNVQIGADSAYETQRFRKSQPALIFPILAKLTFNPNNISIQTFAGPHFTVNFGYISEKTDREIYKRLSRRRDDLSYPPVGLTAGGCLGIKTKSGIMFFDVRYLTDLFTEKFEERYRYNLARRARLSLTAGYEFRLSAK